MDTETTWLIESYPDDPQDQIRVQEITSALQGLGQAVTPFKYRPFSSIDDLGLPKKGNFAVLCSTNLAKKVRTERPDWNPGVWFNEEAYLVSTYAPKAKGLLLNHPTFFTLEDLIAKKWEVYTEFAQEACIFIRPDDGAKSFKGGILDLQDFDQTTETILNHNDKNLVVCVSSPKNILAEWRIICHRHQIVAAGLYKFQGLITEVAGAPPQALAKAQELLDRGWFPDPLFVIDVALDTNKNYSIVELNSFSCAGLYKVDKTKVFKAAIQEIQK
jgi:hypothetical protein